MFYLQNLITNKSNIMKKQTLIFGMIALMGIFVLTGCEKEEEEMKAVADMNIAEYASSNSNFSILVEALAKLNWLTYLTVQVTLPFLLLRMKLLKLSSQHLEFRVSLI